MRQTEQNEGADGEDHLQDLALEGSGRDQVAELSRHPDDHVERDDHCSDLERGRIVNPCGPDEDGRSHDPHEPSKEDFLGWNQST